MLGIKKSQVGDDYYKLLKDLPYNESYYEVNRILTKFYKSDATNKSI